MAHSHVDTGLAALFENPLFRDCPVPTWIFDRATLKFLAVNPAALAVYGYTRAEFLAMRVVDIRPEEEKRSFISTAAQPSGVGVERAGIWQHRSKDGRIFNVDIVSVPSTLEGRAVETVFAAPVRQAELKLRQQLQPRDEWRDDSALAAMSIHEIRTPVQVILTALVLLEMSPLSQEQKEAVRAAKSASDALLVAVRDVVDIARSEQGKLTVSPSDIEVATLLEESRCIMLPPVTARGLTFNVSIDADVPKVAFWDGERVRQVLINLIGNALKFTDRGAVSVRARSTSRSGLSYVRFEVLDTGIGIREEVRLKLFEPFVQGATTEGMHAQGAGLGLTICRTLVELMGGTIGADSRPEGGASFWFEIPVHTARVG
jgi:PAS domain S-box-containing protein